MCIAGRLPYCKRFPTSTRDFLGTVSGTWAASFCKFVLQTASMVWRRVKICLMLHTLRDETCLLLPKTFAKHMQQGSLDHQQRTGWTEELLSAYVAKQFWGQQQQPAFFKTTQEISRRQRLTFTESMRRTLKLSSPAEVLVLSPSHLPCSTFPFFSRPAWCHWNGKLRVEAIKRYSEYLNNSQEQNRCVPSVFLQKAARMTDGTQRLLGASRGILVLTFGQSI